jgi:hypothetical protein
MIRTVILAVVLTAFVGAMGWSVYRGYRSSFTVPDDTRQLIVGITPSWSSNFVEIRRFERDATGKPWRQVGPVSVEEICCGLALVDGGLWPKREWMPRWMPNVAWKQVGDDKHWAGVLQFVSLNPEGKFSPWVDNRKNPLYILLPAAEYRQLWLGNFRASNPGLPTIQ